MTRLGRQYIIRLESCQDVTFVDSSWLITSVTAVAIESGLSIVKEVYHNFEPMGLTLALILSTSHLLLHTWPEHSMVIVDLFLCQDGFAVDSFVNKLADVTKAASFNIECVFDE